MPPALYCTGTEFVDFNVSVDYFVGQSRALLQIYMSLFGGCLCWPRVTSLPSVMIWLTHIIYCSVLLTGCSWTASSGDARTSSIPVFMVSAESRDCRCLRLRLILTLQYLKVVLSIWKSNDVSSIMKLPRHGRTATVEVALYLVSFLLVKCSSTWCGALCYKIVEAILIGYPT